MGWKSNLTIVSILLFILYFSSSAYGLAVASAYLPENTLQIEKGTEAEYWISIQNGEERDIPIGIEVSGDLPVRIKGESNITIPNKTYDNKVFFIIRSDESSIIGKTYTINYKISPFVASTGGMIPMAFNYNLNFKVKIIPPQEKVKQSFFASMKDSLYPVYLKTAAFISLAASNMVVKTIIMILMMALAIVILVVLWKRSTVLADSIRLRIKNFVEAISAFISVLTNANKPIAKTNIRIQRIRTVFGRKAVVKPAKKKAKKAKKKSKKKGKKKAKKKKAEKSRQKRSKRGKKKQKKAKKKTGKKAKKKRKTKKAAKKRAKGKKGKKKKSSEKKPKRSKLSKKPKKKKISSKKPKAKKAKKSKKVSKKEPAKSVSQKSDKKTLEHLLHD